jgi:hypothetical protein
MRRIRALALSGLVGLALAGRTAVAEDPADPLARTPEAWRVLVPRWSRLRLRPGLTLYGRTAGRTTDPYPYALVATDEMRAAGRAHAVLPDSFGRVVTEESLATGAGATEAVRFFVHGREVRDAATASRVLAEVRRLAPTLVHARLEAAPDATPESLLAEPRLARDAGGFVVRLLLLQTDVQVRLVAATGRVDPSKGRVTVEERVVVSGPATELLVCGTGEDLAELERRRVAILDEVARIRRALLGALDPRRTREAVRRLARPGVTMAEVRAALGEPDDDVGSGIHVWVYALDEGAVLVGEAGRVHYVVLVSPVPGSPFPAEETSEALLPRER